MIPKKLPVYPYRYFLGLEEPLTKKLAKKVNQTVTLYSNGNFLIKKGNYKIEIKKGDNYTKKIISTNKG
ncbi:hypothetical protein J8641_09685 [Neisseria elongata subsp. nitroreducens]|uniref:Uncharacterized protein n=1 Tax=Neisseria elongata subsp. nitroreducens TaxID=90367 RepID=A0A9X0ZVB0_NEIEL|nr:hypothetical protein [Neisseria elongata subsp. nitroreducens]